VRSKLLGLGIITFASFLCVSNLYSQTTQTAPNQIKEAQPARPIADAAQHGGFQPVSMGDGTLEDGTWSHYLAYTAPDGKNVWIMRAKFESVAAITKWVQNTVKSALNVAGQGPMRVGDAVVGEWTNLSLKEKEESYTALLWTEGSVVREISSSSLDDVLLAEKVFFPTYSLGHLETAQVNAQATYTLKATPKTVAWGYYDAKATPVLHVKSGDTVQIDTLITNSPKRLEDAGLPPEQVEQSLRDITDQVKDKGPGGHILTGPIYVEDAQPGDVLEVKILAIKLAIPYAYNAFGPGRGYIPDDYPYAKMKIIPLDEKRMIAKFAPGIEIPLHPFFGSMGDAPPESAGRFNSAPPWIMAGNLDNKDLVAGTTLYIPVHAPGALFEVGDGHAGQGDGEVDITALETSLVGTFQFIVRKDMHLKWPRAETPTHYITMGLNDDLNACATLAVREMIDFLVTEKHLSRDDAYMLASVAADLHITELVDGNKGVHMMIPKSIFVSGSVK
jgi:acetamidase/formamidase